jgi:hypothetical protein
VAGIGFVAGNEVEIEIGIEFVENSVVVDCADFVVDSVDFVANYSVGAVGFGSVVEAGFVGADFVVVVVVSVGCFVAVAVESAGAVGFEAFVVVVVNSFAEVAASSAAVVDDSVFASADSHSSAYSLRIVVSVYRHRTHHLENKKVSITANDNKLRKITNL